MTRFVKTYSTTKEIKELVWEKTNFGIRMMVLNRPLFPLLKKIAVVLGHEYTDAWNGIKCPKVHMITYEMS